MGDEIIVDIIRTSTTRLQDEYMKQLCSHEFPILVVTMECTSNCTYCLLPLQK